MPHPRIEKPDHFIACSRKKTLDTNRNTVIKKLAESDREIGAAKKQGHGLQHLVEALHVHGVAAPEHRHFPQRIKHVLPCSNNERSQNDEQTAEACSFAAAAERQKRRHRHSNHT